MHRASLLVAALAALMPSTSADVPGLPTATPVRELQLAAAPDGHLLLALLTDAGEYNSGRGEFTARHVTMWTLQGGAWQPLGGLLNYDQPRPASNLNLALDEQGAPFLAWNENYGDNDVVVFRAFLNGAWTDWRERYLGDDLPYAARTRSLAAHDGEPVLAWGEYLRKPYGSRLTVRRWDAAAKSWVRTSPFNDIRAFSRTPALALDAAGQPTVAWLQGEVLSSDVFVKRWTSGGWVALGASLNRHPHAYVASTRLALDLAGRPVVAWLEDAGGRDTLFASRWTGREWTALGGPVSAGFASAPALALDRAGQPVLAWVEEVGGVGRVRAARWDGRAWRDVGRLNRDERRDARSPAVAVTADGAVIVAWREDVRGRYQVQLQRVAP
ncbi:hypothetical protein [Deinococcus maricopensis]|uniref:Uncharacterized protein n=1 Tax=Deinococcus maricopensis (strain DSM 21211 / LMG 22137 / NRRL B-23946 / LB-34) TaxID=709986 RepID=E8U4U9_DEIML|nr:hypothetical protein [Deinococcus maricopensis]ADV66088.1 hypothetical protein Deima_0428 [Deinococcus maricopensis DSM 21211]